jgi:hypothetical protein
MGVVMASIKKKRYTVVLEELHQKSALPVVSCRGHSTVIC